MASIDELRDLARQAETEEDFEELCRTLVREGFLRVKGSSMFKVRRRSDGLFWQGKGNWSIAGRSYTSWGRALGYATQLTRGHLRARSWYEKYPAPADEVYEAVEIAPLILRREAGRK